MSKIKKALIKYDDGVRSSVARWETPQYGRTTELDHPMELQADRTEIAQTGHPEVAAPLYIAPLCGAERSAPLQEIAETVRRALACLTDRLIWPYCLPLMAERCLKLHNEIDGAHGAYVRCAKRNGANLILSGLYGRLAWLLVNSLLGERDHTPRNRFGNNEVISVQDWLATRGVPQSLAQRWGRNGSNVSKETVVKTVQSNLMELRARHGRVHGRRGSAMPPNKPGLTAVANTAAPRQTFE